MNSVRTGATVLAVSFALSACGPLSPSVSKFSGAKSANKGINTKIFTTDTTDDKITNHAETSPEVVKQSDLDSDTASLEQNRHGQTLSASQVAAFKNDGTVSIAQADASVTGTFVDHVPKIHVGTTGLTMWERSNLEGSIRVSFDAGVLGKDRIIRISLKSPDPAKDPQGFATFSSDSQTLRESITGIVLTFDDSGVVSSGSTNANTATE